MTGTWLDPEPTTVEPIRLLPADMAADPDTLEMHPVYATRRAATEAMLDPRYFTDAEYAAEVKATVARSLAAGYLKD